MSDELTNSRGDPEPTPEQDAQWLEECVATRLHGTPKKIVLAIASRIRKREKEYTDSLRAMKVSQIETLLNETATIRLHPDDLRELRLCAAMIASSHNIQALEEGGASTPEGREVIAEYARELAAAMGEGEQTEPPSGVPVMYQSWWKEISGKLIEAQQRIAELEEEHRVAIQRVQADAAAFVNKAVELEAGYQRKSIDSHPCPGCKYEDGKFIEPCELHRQIDEQRERIAELESLVEVHGGEKGLTAWRRVCKRQLVRLDTATKLLERIKKQADSYPPRCDSHKENMCNCDHCAWIDTMVHLGRDEVIAFLADTPAEVGGGVVAHLQQRLDTATTLLQRCHEQKLGVQLSAAVDAFLQSTDTPAAEAHERWNVEETDSGIRLCRGEHDRAQGCAWEYYVRAAEPADNDVLLAEAWDEGWRAGYNAACLPDDSEDDMPEPTNNPYLDGNEPLPAEPAKDVTSFGLNLTRRLSHDGKTLRDDASLSFIICVAQQEYIRTQAPPAVKTKVLPDVKMEVGEVRKSQPPIVEGDAIDFDAIAEACVHALDVEFYAFAGGLEKEKAPRFHKCILAVLRKHLGGG